MPPISVNIFSVESLIFSFTLTTREGEMDVIGTPVWGRTGEKNIAHIDKKKHFFHGVQPVN